MASSGLVLLLVSMMAVAMRPVVAINCFSNNPVTSPNPIVTSGYSACVQSFVNFRYPANRTFVTYEGWVFSGSNQSDVFDCAMQAAAELQVEEAKWEAVGLYPNVFFGSQQTTCCATDNCNNPANVPFTNSQSRLLPNYFLVLATLLGIVLVKTLWL